MKRRPLGRTTLSVSEIGSGCGPTAGLMVQGDATVRRNTVARALELGIDIVEVACRLRRAHSDYAVDR